MEKIHIITLGCSKNTVDSEYMLGVLKEGYELTSDIEESDIVIINTCAFIKDAKEESINTIFEVVNLKNDGIVKKIVVAGCLSQRYYEELLKEIPEIDLFIGTSNYDEILKILEESKAGAVVTNPSRIIPDRLPRVLTESKHYAYVKIAEGCDNLCTYCIIPQLRGKYRSRKMEDILEEVGFLAEKGIREIIVIAQDTSKYGIDLYGEKKLHTLLERISEIEGVEWVRVHYIYPEDFYGELLETFAVNEKLLNYFEIPLQHVNDNVLKRMNRHTNRKSIEALLTSIRNRIPDAAIRTTFIVGFPGETEEQFEELEKFVEEFKFDRLGVFAYSEEEGTPAARMMERIDEDIREERRSILMEKQMNISIEKNKGFINKRFDVIIDSYVEENRYIGRTYMDSPDIDGVVYVDSKHELKPGDIVDVKITESLEYDLIGEYYELAQ
ncbi:SSU ribosomal protein S12P methylthiotransferase [Dethiosulfatibacter aminovorans DSM 17477]|uniref:Ribosomal protein uS12 methylthiotransferase RimO n=1 Tax=Dethiosulfatibacter aminovorans DSM 17477 TaxID=1121476 RepID=A0A1M6DCQ9_9FIRM|nr:30S ribosomal protein S12 methylthiotransferase RimO [Dethiosulfatibacter aminovorans]SHI70989.1 SSU ribosomal protein S12P methylthiotransferase [Dethiosulfatibacter aminovorans DSM 17477]